MTSMPIRIESINKSYGDFVALDNVCLEIQPGEFLALLGPSGSGKTTLLMTIAGFTRPDSGRILFGDRNLARLPPNKRDIGIIFQSYALFPHMSVLGNVEYPLKVRSVSKTESRDRALKALSRVKLDGFAGRRISELSGGQRQRVALARAAVFEPQIMLMDEPLSALDKNLREQMQLEIRQLHNDLGITTIYVTHDQREALTMSDRIAVMSDGRIQQIDIPEEIYRHPSTAFVAHFMGEANVLPTHKIRFLSASNSLGDQALMVRAEHLHLDRREVLADGVALTGTLFAKSFRGDSWMLQLDIGAERKVVASIPSSRAEGCADFSIGEQITVFADRKHIHAIGCDVVTQGHANAH